MLLKVYFLQVFQFKYTFLLNAVINGVTCKIINKIYIKIYFKLISCEKAMRYFPETFTGCNKTITYYFMQNTIDFV